MEKLPSLDLGSKKKKKKKTSSRRAAGSSVAAAAVESVVAAGEAAPVPQAAAATAAAAAQDAPVAAIPAAFGELNLGDKKKKRRPKREAGEKSGGGEEQEAAEEPVAATATGKRAKPRADEEDTPVVSSAATADEEYNPDEVMMGLYSYSYLLGRVYEEMKDRNLDHGVQKRTLKQPHVVKDGAKKTAFTNLIDICKSMNRDPEHCKEFLLSELGTTGNMDGQGSLIIRGKFQAKSVTSILRRYINAYVVCEMCRSLDTSLSRDSATRLYRLYCENCGASRSVAPINKMFTAVIRRPRK